MQPELQKRLHALNQLNETKGQELSTLMAIPQFRTDAENASDWEAVAESYWQEHLAHQHIVMNQDDKDGSHVAAMLTAAQKAVEVVETHSLENLRGHAHRFLGRAFTYQGRHQEALNEYSQAAKIFAEFGDIRLLEVNGFLAESLIRTGSINEGLEIAFTTFEDYDREEYIGLKNTDYYKWAVWRTGIFPRLVTALEEMKIDYDHSRIREYIEKSKTYITDPELFAYRIKEIEDTLDKLE